MIAYQLILQFNNLDNSLYTSQQAEMTMEIKADDYGHAYLLGQRMCKVMDADTFYLSERE